MAFGKIKCFIGFGFGIEIFTDFIGAVNFIGSNICLFLEYKHYFSKSNVILLDYFDSFCVFKALNVCIKTDKMFGF